MGWAERIVEMLLDAVCAVDRGGHFVFVNPAFEQLLGYPREELLGRRMMDFMHPEELERTSAIAHAVMAGLSIRDFRNRYIRRDGAVLHVTWSARWSEDDQVRIAVARDMTPLVREEALKATALEISQAALENESLDWTWRRIEAAFERHLGGEAPVALLREAHAVKRLGSVWATASDELISAAERAAPDGRPDASGAEWNYAAIDCPPIRGWLGLHRSASARVDLDAAGLAFLASQVGGVLRLKALEAQLREAALHDPLTGVANRRLFTDRAQLALDRAERAGHGFGLLFVDIDAFKTINDRFGHAQGVAVLVAVARELEARVRRTDTVARIGGDEFVVIVDGPVPEGHLEAIATDLVERFGADTPDLPAISVGIALYPRDGRTVGKLLGAADKRMYRAKARCD